MSKAVVISGVGLWKPPHVVTNAELVASYNAFADLYNAEHAVAIAAGDLTEKPHSSEAFIEKASGIKQRYAYVKEGILDPQRMRPCLPVRDDRELSHQAEMALASAERALTAANASAADIDPAPSRRRQSRRGCFPRRWTASKRRGARFQAGRLRCACSNGVASLNA